MIENKIYETIWNACNDLEPGFPRYQIRPPWPRGDRELTMDKFHESLLEEGRRLGPIEEITIGEDRSILVFNTCAGSPHTPLRVPYNDFDREYRVQAREQGIEVPDEPLIQIQVNGELSRAPIIPLDMLVWTMLKDEAGRLMPVDLNDFVQHKQICAEGYIDPNSSENKFKLQLSEEKIIEIFSQIHRRGDIARKTFLNLYNNVIRRELSVQTLSGNTPLLPEKHLEDILQGIAVGYYRGDESKDYDQFEYDHLGMGPMSNPIAHYRVTAHLPMENFNRLNLNSSHASLEDIMHILRQKSDYFDTSIDLVHMKPDLFAHDLGEREVGGALQKMMEVVDPYDLLKLIDPYATIACEVLNPWLQEQFQEIFGDFASEVRQFQHNGGEYDRELRSTEGVEVIVPAEEVGSNNNNLIKSQMYAKVVRVIGERVFPMWTDIRDYVAEKAILSDDEIAQKLQTLQQKHKLPEEAIEMIKKIKPTERQLTNLLKRGEISDGHKQKIETILLKYKSDKKYHAAAFSNAYEQLVHGEGTIDDVALMTSSLQKLQLYDSNWNRGFNIPGVPSFAITHNRLGDGNYRMMIGLLLSQKGLSEAWLGASLSRPT